MVGVAGDDIMNGYQGIEGHWGLKSCKRHSMAMADRLTTGLNCLSPEKPLVSERPLVRDKPLFKTYLSKDTPCSAL
jgi:hypothetical protein